MNGLLLMGAQILVPILPGEMAYLAEDFPRMLSLSCNKIKVRAHLFTMAFGAGLKYYAPPYLGIKLHTQLYLPFWSSSLYLGWYGGTTGTISALCSPYMNFNVGIFANIDRSYSY